MTAQENESVDKADDTEATAEASTSDAQASTDDAKASTDSVAPNEKPEPDEAAKEQAAKMMEAYVDQPTLVLPGTGGAVSGTAVNDWLDDEGNPAALGDDDAPAAKADAGQSGSEDGDTESPDEGLSLEEQMEKDKEYNKAVIEQAEREEGMSDEEKARSEREEKSVTR